MKKYPTSIITDCKNCKERTKQIHLKGTNYICTKCHISRNALKEMNKIYQKTL